MDLERAGMRPGRSIAMCPGRRFGMRPGRRVGRGHGQRAEMRPGRRVGMYRTSHAQSCWGQSRHDCRNDCYLVTWPTTWILE